jgi:hypothetical protein
MGQGPWAKAHGIRPMGQGPGPMGKVPWARAHGPSPLGQAPWARAQKKKKLAKPQPGMCILICL